MVTLSKNVGTVQYTHLLKEENNSGNKSGFCTLLCSCV